MKLNQAHFGIWKNVHEVAYKNIHAQLSHNVEMILYVNIRHRINHLVTVPVREQLHLKTLIEWDD